MNILEGGHSGHFFIDFWIILHRTASERIETGIHTEIHIGQIGVMSHYIRLAHLRKRDRGSSPEILRKICRRAAIERLRE